jgi:hypothetical protein
MSEKKELTGLTEKEAEEKWCPHARKIVHEQRKPSHNMEEVGDGVVYRTKCIASACMMWRWLPLRKATKAGPITIGNSTTGYCGLGGEL